MVSEQAVSAVATSEGSALTSFFSMGEHSSIVDYVATTMARGAQDVLPRPLPVSGAIPTGAGSSSSGLASSGLGVGGGALAALAILFGLSPFGGRLLRSSRDFLRPTSAFVLAIERPG